MDELQGPRGGVMLYCRVSSVFVFYGCRTPSLSSVSRFWYYSGLLNSCGAFRARSVKCAWYHYLTRACGIVRCPLSVNYTPMKNHAIPRFRKCMSHVLLLFLQLRARVFAVLLCHPGWRYTVRHNIPRPRCRLALRIDGTKPREDIPGTHTLTGSQIMAFRIKFAVFQPH